MCSGLGWSLLRHSPAARAAELRNCGLIASDALDDVIHVVQDGAHLGGWTLDSRHHAKSMENVRLLVGGRVALSTVCGRGNADGTLQEVSLGSIPATERLRRLGGWHFTNSTHPRRGTGVGACKQAILLVGASGIEPETSAMSTQRSYQLSYAPTGRAAPPPRQGGF
jgi:hypothetical protein